MRPHGSLLICRKGELVPAPPAGVLGAGREGGLPLRTPGLPSPPGVPEGTPAPHSAASWVSPRAGTALARGPAWKEGRQRGDRVREL